MAAALLTEADLTPTERRLCECAAEGRRLDLRTGRADDDDPAQGQTWEARRQIRSQLLYQLLTGRETSTPDSGLPEQYEYGEHSSSPRSI